MWLYVRWRRLGPAYCSGPYVLSRRIKEDRFRLKDIPQPYPVFFGVKLHIIVTTTRHVNPRVRSLANELAHTLPDALRINRGKSNISDLAEKARAYNAKTVLIVGKGLRGNPGRLVFLRIMEREYFFYPLIVSLAGVKLARELKVRPSPVSTESFSIVTLEDFSDNTKELALALSEALQVNYTETSNLKSLAHIFNRVLFVEETNFEKSPFFIKFVKPDGKNDGPLLKVKRVIYKPPL